jgi:hypothetical protein
VGRRVRFCRYLILVSDVQARWDWSWSVPLVVTGALLGLLALGRLAIGLQAIGEAQQLDYGEPIVYSQAARILNGEQLYQPLDRPPFTVAAYTPLYYKIASELQARVGPGFGPGRALSYAAGLATSAAVAWLAARQTRSAWAGAFAAVLFVGLGFPGTVPWFALYRVDMLAEALSLGAIVVLAFGTSARFVFMAGVLAGLAVLTKQSFIAAALAGAIWLWSFSPRRAVLFGGIAGLLTLIVCLGEELTSHAFTANAVLANANPISIDQLFALAVLFGQTLGLPVVIAIACLWLVRPWQTASTRLLIVYWVTSALMLVGLAKFGASYNYWIEFAAATVVLATLGVWTARASRQSFSRLVSRALVWLLAVDVAIAAPTSVAAGASGLSGRATLTGLERASSADFQALVDVVRAEPGAVLAEPLDVVVLARRPIMLEPVIFSILERQGQWDSEPLVRRICSGEVRLLVLAFPIAAVAAYAPYREPWWPPSVMSALQDCMRPDGQRAGRFLYTPASASSR